MVLSKQGRMILDWLCVVYSNDEATENLTEQQIEETVAKEASRFGGLSADEIALIVRKLIALVGVYKPEDECIVDGAEYDAQAKDWFTKIKADHDEWFTAYLAKLRQKQWSPNVIRELDKSSDAIMNHLGNPRSPKFNIRGLVMGDIQSGKTANFIALCNKAADAGYRVIDAEDIGMEEQLCFLEVRSSGEQCLGATQPVLRLLGESPKPQICSFRAGNAFM